MVKQKKCYIYTRVSTAIQVDGYSLEAQKDKLRKYAEYQNMTIVSEFSDKGFFGKNIKGRPEFSRMMEKIESGEDNVDFVLVFKLSRFGRNAADVLNSLQIMQDYGVNLICVEDGIDSSKDAGNLLIAEDEVEIIRIIYDRYIHTNSGINGVASYLNDNGYTKKLRQNNTIPGFSSSFVKSVLDNPVYMGKIAYGRRRTEKKIGTRNEMHIVEQSEFPVYEGCHEAIISESDWKLAFESAIKKKIGTAVDTSEIEVHIEALRRQLKQVMGTKTRLEHQMDNLDISDPHYDKKISDLQRRYDEQYDKSEAIEAQIEEWNSRLLSVRQEKISADNVYQLLLAFDNLYNTFCKADQKDFMRAFIERIDLYPEKPDNDRWIRNIVFNFPMPVKGKEIKTLPLEKRSTVETVVLLGRELFSAYGV